MKGSEINEEIEEKNKTGKSSMSISTFLSNFSRDYIEKRPANVKNQLIEELMIKDSLSWTLASKWLAEFRASDEKYSEVDIDDKNIDVYMLRKYVTKSYLLQEKSQKNFQEYVLEEYDISSEKYINKVESEAKQLSWWDLDRMIWGWSEIQKFLEKCLWAWKVQQRTNFNLLEGVTEKQFHDRLKKIKSPEREELSEILEKLQKNQTPRDDEIRAIVESSILDDKQKELFVHTFLPFINLQQAIDIGLKSQWEAEKIHKKYISTLLNWSDLSKENQEKVAEQISFSDIDVKTRDIVWSWSDAIKISEWIGFQKYVDDLDHNNQELLEQVRAHWPQSFQEMIVAIGAINQGNQYQNLQAFTPGNIVKFSKVGTDWEVQIDFVEIVSFDDQQKEFSFRNVWNDSINLKNPWESTWVEYQDFVEWLKEDSKTSFEVISRDVIQEKIKKWEIKSSSLTTLVAPDLEWEENFERRQEIKEKHIDELEREFSELEVKFSRAEDSQKKEIQRDLDKISKELAEFRDASDISAEHAAELYNRQEFLRKLDEVDSKGSSLWFWLWVAFRVGEKMLEWDFWTYTVRSIDYENWTVSFYGESWVEKDVDLTAFFENFKEKKATRHKSFNNPDELISWNEVFKNHEFKNGDIIAKNAEDGEGKSADRPVEFLRAKKGKKIIRISSLSWGYADVQIWETEDAKLTDAEKDRGDKKTNIKIKWAKTHTWTLDELHRFIEQEELEPDWKAGQTMTIVPQEHQNKFHGSFTNKFFKWMSIYDVIHGWKTVVVMLNRHMQH
jgi:hypothetical protein